MQVHEPAVEVQAPLPCVTLPLWHDVVVLVGKVLQCAGSMPVSFSTPSRVANRQTLAVQHAAGGAATTTSTSVSSSVRQNMATERGLADSSKPAVEKQPARHGCEEMQAG